MGEGAVRRYLAEQDVALREASASLRRGDRSAVHATRVAVRRARSTLRTFAACFDPAAVRQLDAALEAHARRMGDVRDLEVLVGVVAAGREAGWVPAALGAWAVARLEEELDAAWSEASAELAAEEDDAMTARFATVLASSGPGGVKTGRRARAAERRAVRRLVTAGGDPDALHDARKAAKRARYAAEVAGRHRAASQQRHVQQVLGAHHDLILAARWLAGARLPDELRPDARRLVVRLEAEAADRLADLA